LQSLPCSATRVAYVQLSKFHSSYSLLPNACEAYVEQAVRAIHNDVHSESHNNAYNYFTHKKERANSKYLDDKVYGTMMKRTGYISQHHDVV